MAALFYTLHNCLCDLGTNYKKKRFYWANAKGVTGSLNTNGVTGSLNTKSVTGSLKGNLLNSPVFEKSQHKG